jgi:hypothetical protein
MTNEHQSTRGRVVVAILTACSVFFGGKGTARAGADEADIPTAARQALEQFVRAYDTPAMRVDRGFDADDDFSDLTLGAPFAQFVLKQDALQDASTDALDTLLGRKGEWFVPVFTRGRPACLVSVVDLDGRWEPGRLGMPELARAWQAVTQAWPAAEGYRPELVLYPPRQEFYFRVPQHETPNLTLLDIRAPEATSVGAKRRLTPAAEALERLRAGAGDTP